MNLKKYLAEFIGTFALVFCGTGAIIINQETHGSITHVGVAMTFGLIVMVRFSLWVKFSGSHLNPAVTVALFVSKRFEKKYIFPYLMSQFLGAFLASLLLHSLFSDNQNLGSTLPQGSDYQSFILEFVLTFLLMLVILNVSNKGKESGTPPESITAAVAIGSTIGLEAMFAGPICGASMNPIRSLAPAIVSGNLQSLWIYLTAPFIGAIFAVFIHQILYKTDQ